MDTLLTTQKRRRLCHQWKAIIVIGRVYVLCKWMPYKCTVRVRLITRSCTFLPNHATVITTCHLLVAGRYHFPYKTIPFKYHWMVLGGIMAKDIWMVSEWYFDDILDSLYRSMVLNGILHFHWEYYWVLLKYHWMVQWYSMIFNGIPLALFCKGWTQRLTV